MYHRMIRFWSSLVAVLQGLVSANELMDQGTGADDSHDSVLACLGASIWQCKWDLGVPLLHPSIAPM